MNTMNQKNITMFLFIIFGYYFIAVVSAGEFESCL